MGWSLGYDDNWNRFIGYGVPAYCDYPRCNKEIDRGLANVCGSDPYGGEDGCGLFFCSDHLIIDKRKGQLCKRCCAGKKPYKPKPEHPKWINHILTDKTWKEWRKQNKEYVEELKNGSI